jgi:hypothetical protein
MMTAGADNTGSFQLIRVDVLGIDRLPPAQQERCQQSQLADSLMMSERRDHVC